MIEIQKVNSNIDDKSLFNDNAKFINIPVNMLLTMYSDNKQVEEEKLVNIKKKDYFFMRGGERALVSTGLKFNIPQGSVLIITPESSKAVSRGLTILNAPVMIYPDDNNEVVLILYNSTKNLLKVSKNDIVAYGTLVETKDIVFSKTDASN